MHTLVNIAATGGTDPTLSSLVLGFGLPGGYEWVILLALGLLLFGRRLPEVGRSMGLGITEFKKGLKGITDDVTEDDDTPAKKPAEPAKLQTPPPTDASGQDVRVSQRDAVE